MRTVRDYVLTPIGVLLALLLAILLGFGITMFVIWLDTSSSGVRGNAAVTRQHNSGQNQVDQNTKLLGANATVQADIAKIATLAPNVVTEQDRIDLQGLELNCTSDVQTYNADVQNILATGYLPTGLPEAYPPSACAAPTS